MVKGNNGQLYYSDSEDYYVPRANNNESPQLPALEGHIVQLAKKANV